MKTEDDAKIAGDFRKSDWKTIRETLKPNGEPGDWALAYTMFFLTRLETRYFGPIRLLQKHGDNKGEGFSIVALQCTLIEYLASTYEGKAYEWDKAKRDNDEFLYLLSGNIFRKFLQTAPVFKYLFADECKTGDCKPDQCEAVSCKANEFYKNVRCPLVHEARTKGRWTILANSDPKKVKISDRIIDWGGKTIYRDNFQTVFENFVKAYRAELLISKERQEAFIRKFNYLCKE